MAQYNNSYGFIVKEIKYFLSKAIVLYDDLRSVIYILKTLTF